MHIQHILEPDLVLHGGKVVTVNATFNVAQAIAIRGDRIVGVGSDAEMLALCGERTRRVSLAGRTVIPGLIDVHFQLFDRAAAQYFGAHVELPQCVEDVLFAGVTLPVPVANAINEKLIAQQQSDAYKYRIASERQESERKAIEAEGIRAFQATVNSSISSGYLKWKGVDATLELAKSNNAKVVVIGGGKDGMPVILGGLDNNGPPTIAVPATSR